MKGLRVTNIIKEIKFEEVWGELESKKRFSKTISHKVFETSSSFHVKAHYRKSLIAIFQKFLLVLKSFSFFQEDRTLAYHSMKFRHFPNIF